MKKMMTVLALTIPMMVANAQMSENELSTDNSDERVTSGPEYLGGEQALTNYFQDALQYPEMATIKGVEGTVILQFYILPNGSINDDITILRSVGAGLDEEAVRLVNEMPLWLPAMQNGVAVKVRYDMPIQFELR